MLNMQEVDRLLQKTILYAIGKTKEARLMLGVYNNFLNFKVFIRDINANGQLGKSKMAVYLPFNRQAIMAFIEQMKRVRNSKDEVSFTMESLSPVWENDKMTNETKPNGKISIVKKKKDDELLNYIVVENALSGKQIVFLVGPSPYVRLYKNGKELSRSEASNVWLDGYIKTLESVLELFPEVFADQITYNETDAGRTKSLPNNGSKKSVNQEETSNDNADTVDVSDSLDDIGSLDDLGI